MSDEVLYSAGDQSLTGFLGETQKWWCPLCETQLELGSEVITFVGYPDGSLFWPIVVHSECRTGLNARNSMKYVWGTLSGGDKRAKAVERVENARKDWVAEMQVRFTRHREQTKS
jgi:hypothetical protein